jgi:tetratricopeptide (TPR) repeat protein
VPGRADPTANTFQLLRDWLLDSKHAKWLLVLDNLDNAQSLLEPPSTFAKDAGKKALHRERVLDYFPVTSHGSILVTSRTTDAALKIVESKAVIAVEPMGIDQAVELLRRKLECEYTPEEALELTKALDFMPLAINQAAAYVRHASPRCSVSHYLRRFKESEKSKLSLLDVNDGDLRRDREATNSIISTWQISFEHIRAIRPSASDLLSLMSFFDRQSIQESVLRGLPATQVGYRKRLKEKWSSLRQFLCKPNHNHAAPGEVLGEVHEIGSQAFDRDIALLRSYSFISAATAETFTMHSLVQLSTRKWLRARSEEEYWNAQFVRCLDAAFPKRSRYMHWSVCEALYPHVKATLDLKPTDQAASTTWAMLLLRCAEYASDKGLTEDACTMASLSTGELTRNEGQESKSALRGMMLLADMTASDMSSPTVDTERSEAQLVTICKRSYGEDTVQFAKCKGILADSYRRQGRLKDAEDIQVKVVESLKRLQGDEHSDTLVGMTRLSAIYRDQKRYERAADLEVGVLEVRKRVLGLRHPKTASSMEKLAAAFAGLGLFDGAAALATQALDIQTEVLGPGHLKTLTSMATLSSVYTEQKLYDKAISLSAKELEMRTKVLGRTHASTLTNMRNLALIYSRQRTFGKALELASEAFETSKRVFGPEHPDTLDRLATLEYIAGRLKSASDHMGHCAARYPRTVEGHRFAKEWSMELRDPGPGQGNIQSVANTEAGSDE